LEPLGEPHNNGLSFCGDGTVPLEIGKDLEGQHRRHHDIEVPAEFVGVVFIEGVKSRLVQNDGRTHFGDLGGYQQYSDLRTRLSIVRKWALRTEIAPAARTGATEVAI
jgi:hypothetical protein